MGPFDSARLSSSDGESRVGGMRRTRIHPAAL
jgi:hypothetical protein